MEQGLGPFEGYLSHQENAKVCFNHTDCKVIQLTSATEYSLLDSPRTTSMFFPALMMATSDCGVSTLPRGVVSSPLVNGRSSSTMTPSDVGIRTCQRSNGFSGIDMFQKLLRRLARSRARSSRPSSVGKRTNGRTARRLPLHDAARGRRWCLRPKSR